MVQYSMVDRHRPDVHVFAPSDDMETPNGKRSEGGHDYSHQLWFAHHNLFCRTLRLLCEHQIFPGPNLYAMKRSLPASKY
jgi:hypothetical protein